MTAPTEREAALHKAVFDTIDEWDCDPDHTMSELADLIIAEHIEPLHARLTAIVHAAGGMVEGAPTQSINVLERIRALVAAESRASALERERVIAVTNYKRSHEMLLKYFANAGRAALAARTEEGGDA